MLATYLYTVTPNIVSPSLRSCFIVLLVVSNSWRFLLLRGGIPLDVFLLLVECLFHSHHMLEGVLLT